MPFHIWENFEPYWGVFPKKISKEFFLSHLTEISDAFWWGCLSEKRQKNKAVINTTLKNTYKNIQKSILLYTNEQKCDIIILSLWKVDNHDWIRKMGFKQRNRSVHRYK